MIPDIIALQCFINEFYHVHISFKISCYYHHCVSSDSFIEQTCTCDMISESDAGIPILFNTLRKKIK